MLYAYCVIAKWIIFKRSVSLVPECFGPYKITLKNVLEEIIYQILFTLVILWLVWKSSAEAMWVVRLLWGVIAINDLLANGVTNIGATPTMPNQNKNKSHKRALSMYSDTFPALYNNLIYSFEYSSFILFNCKYRNFISWCRGWKLLKMRGQTSKGHVVCRRWLVQV